MEIPGQTVVYISGDKTMTAEAKQALEALLPGQLWKTENSYILITDHGKRLVGYKKLNKPSQRGVATNLIRPEALVTYLSKVGAQLVVQTQ
jgi:hypothetical protein